MSVIIGVDPHKATHTAVAIGLAEEELSRVQVRATRNQVAQLLTWAEPFDKRTWAIESAGGLGYLLAQQLVAAGEEVLDVPPTLASRVRVLASGSSNKNDPNDARSVAVAALRAPALRCVVAADHAEILRLLAKRNVVSVSGDIRRFRNRDHYAAYNRTAPVEFSSGGRIVHRLSQRGNRQLNHAVHLAALCQIRQTASEGRTYFDRKVAEGKTKKSAPGPQASRLQRRVPAADQRRQQVAGPGGPTGTTRRPARPAHTLKPALRRSHSRTQPNARPALILTAQGAMTLARTATKTAS